MPIDKHSTDILIKVGFHYSTIPTEIEDMITNSDALAIWIHLLGKSVDWKPSKTYLMRRYGLGETRWKAARVCLEDLQLLKLVKGGGNGDHQGGAKWFVSSIPFDMIPMAYRRTDMGSVPSFTPPLKS